MRALKEYGVISSYHDYVGLPLVVIEDARLLFEAQKAHSPKLAKGGR